METFCPELCCVGLVRLGLASPERDGIAMNGYGL